MIRFAPLLALLAACAPAPPAERYLVTATTAAEAIVAPATSVQVREIDLPDYADREEVSLMSDDGAVIFIPGTLWADTPSRSLTRLMATRLSAALPNSKVA
ncbi:MAG: ABC-type transport auxiliary lipoprotein family protein, partial [Pseudomonadota bacterium]